MESKARRVRGTLAFASKAGAGLLLALSLAVSSCSDGGVAGSSSPDVDSTPDIRGDSRSSAQDGADETGSGGQPGDSSSGTDTSFVDTDQGGGGGDPDAGAGTQVYRFIAMGDTGEGKQEQERVSKGAQDRCDRAGGCHGFLMLGDNIYDAGADSANDEQFTNKIDKPYRNLKYGAPPSGQPDNRKRLPIYATLGNHDLGEIPLNREKINYNIDYGQGKPWYYFPAEIWEKKVGPVHLLALHTNPLAYEGQRFDMHTKMVQRVLQNTSAEWTIAFGHHPYRSNGQHGNAGDYEQIPLFGDDYREWVNEQICGKVDFLLTGHDHNRQWIEKMEKLERSLSGGGSGDLCDTHMAVSGAGAKTRDIEDRGNKTAFSSDKLGFLFLEFRTDQVDVEFCDADGNTQWSKTITK